MTKNSYLKNEIRARMAITGESHSAAARAIASGETNPLPGNSNRPRQKTDLKSLVMFIERLRALLSTGMRLDRAFGILSGQTEDETLSSALAAVSEDVSSGIYMVPAMEKHPEAFPGMFMEFFGAMLGSGADQQSSLKALAQVYRTELELSLLKVPEEISPTPRHDLARKARRKYAPHAIYIGPENVGQLFEGVTQQEWEFVYFGSLEEFAIARDSGELEGLSLDALLFADKLYSPEGKRQRATARTLLRKAVEEYSSELFFAVISHDEELREEISGEFADREIYFIDGKTPSLSFNDAWYQWDLAQIAKV